MRYNISVKNRTDRRRCLIISPMNDLNADAAVITDFIYTNATTYSIPLSAMPTELMKYRYRLLTDGMLRPLLRTLSINNRI